MNDIYKLNISYDSGIGTFEETYYFFSKEDAENYTLFLRQGTEGFFYSIHKIEVVDQRIVESRISSMQKQKVVFVFDINPSYEVFSNCKVHKIFVNYRETCVDIPLKFLGIHTKEESESEQKYYNGQMYYTGYFSADTFDNITDKITKTCQSFFNTDCEVVIDWQR